MGESFEEYLRSLGKDALQAKFDFVRTELKRARLQAELAVVELKIKELACKDAEQVLDAMKENYDIVVRVMSERDGD